LTGWQRRKKFRECNFSPPKEGKSENRVQPRVREWRHTPGSRNPAGSRPKSTKGGKKGRRPIKGPSGRGNFKTGTNRDAEKNANLRERS